MIYHWGVDSASTVTKDLYDYVLNNYGKPEYWGRYLNTVSNSVEGLTRDEIQLLHNSGTKILPIFNNFRNAIGYNEGRTVAVNTVFHARRLGVPVGIVLFANVEEDSQVDGAWIRGYVDAILPSGYRPGMLHELVNSKFSRAYCDSVSENRNVANQLILCTAEPELGPTSKGEAPHFTPAKPTCRSNVWGWQYGRNLEVCQIDTSLIHRKLLNLLW